MVALTVAGFAPGLIGYGLYALYTRPPTRSATGARRRWPRSPGSGGAGSQPAGAARVSTGRQLIAALSGRVLAGNDARRDPLDSLFRRRYGAPAIAGLLRLFRAQPGRRGRRGRGRSARRRALGSGSLLADLVRAAAAGLVVLACSSWLMCCSGTSRFPAWPGVCCAATSGPAGLARSVTPARKSGSGSASSSFWRARPAPGAAADPRPGKLVIFSMPLVGWEEVEAGNAPNLARLAQEWSVAAMSLRTVGPRTDMASALVTIGAGNRARAHGAQPFEEGDSDAAPNAIPEEPGLDEGTIDPAVPAAGGAVVTAMPYIQADNADLHFAAFPGELGQRLKLAGLRTGVAGNADGGYIRPTSKVRKGVGHRVETIRRAGSRRPPGKGGHRGDRQRHGSGRPGHSERLPGRPGCPGGGGRPR